MRSECSDLLGTRQMKKIKQQRNGLKRKAHHKYWRRR
jgi:hypothetical protein